MIDSKCEWCGKGSQDVSHHYPIPKSRGGKDMVRICAGCHHRFHYGVLVVDARRTKNKKQLRHKILKKLQRAFPLRRDFERDVPDVLYHN